MHTTVGIATLWAAALASSRTLRRWSLDRYGKAVALRVGVDMRRPPDESDAPFIALFPDAVATGPGRKANEHEVGLLIGLSSVAGDRGRASNYAYGSAKAGFSAFLSGLRARLWNSGVRVLTVKPGYGATGMIAGRHLPSCIVASPELVARDILRAVRTGRDVLYTPGGWWPLLALYRALPECVAKRLKL